MKTHFSKLEKAVIKTICYFDVFNIPLKFNKLFLYLYQHKISSKNQLKKSLDNLISKKIINHFDQYYFLYGRDRIVKLRLSRKRFCVLRWKRAQRAAKILQIIPFIKLVTVTNSLSVDNSNQNSDIDFFIVVKKGRLWIARALTILILDLFLLNKSKYRTANQICLGFFIDSTHMDLSGLKDNQNDMYFTYWLANARPIMDKNYFAKFISKNDWIYQQLPNYDLKKTKLILRDHEIKKNNILLSVSIAIEYIMNILFVNFFEKLLRKIQISRIRKLESDKLAVTKLSYDIMYLGPYNKNKKYNHLASKHYLRYFNE